MVPIVPSAVVIFVVVEKHSNLRGSIEPLKGWAAAQPLRLECYRIV